MDYKDKIRKLLALAESDNEHEAKDALLKAKRLMAIHKIEEADLYDKKKQKVKRLYTGFEYTKRGEWWIGSLGNIIAENYCCRCANSIKGKGAQKREIFFIGFEDDVELCAKIFEYAVESARSLGKNFLKEKYSGLKLTARQKNMVKNSYAYGFAYGVEEAFNKQACDESGWALVMVVPQEVHDECADFREDKYNSNHMVFGDAQDKGFSDGCKFNPNVRIGRCD